MLTKIGVAALLGTMGSAVVGGTAKADEPCRGEGGPVAVTVAAPPVVTTNVDYGYGFGYGHDRDRDRDNGYDRDVGYGYGTAGVFYRRDRREELERMRRERREEAMRHAAWLHRHGGFGWGGDRR